MCKRRSRSHPSKGIPWPSTLTGPQFAHLSVRMAALVSGSPGAAVRVQRDTTRHCPPTYPHIKSHGSREVRITVRQGSPVLPAPSPLSHAQFHFCVD